MKTYFIRHTEKLSIDTYTRLKLWAENRVAIHFPFTKGRDKSVRFADSKSLNPLDYEGTDADAIKTFVEIAKHGGYICSRNSAFPNECLIGMVKPNSKIELQNGFWDDSKSRVSVYKTIKLRKPQKVRIEKISALLVGVPRQGTIKPWNSCGDRINKLVDGLAIDASVDNLLPVEQEIMCSEFLRSKLADKYGLPRAEMFLMPVGRTMENIDIYAMTKDGEIIFSQVTFYKLGSVQAKEKLKRLEEYVSSKNRLVFFCDCEKPQIDNSVFIFPLRLVYSEFISTPIGVKWLKKIGLHLNYGH